MSKVSKFIDRIEKVIEDKNDELNKGSLELFDEYFKKHEEEISSEESSKEDTTEESSEDKSSASEESPKEEYTEESKEDKSTDSEESKEESTEESSNNPTNSLGSNVTSSPVNPTNSLGSNVTSSPVNPTNSPQSNVSEASIKPKESLIESSLNYIKEMLAKLLSLGSVNPSSSPQSNVSEASIKPKESLIESSLNYIKEMLAKLLSRDSDSKEKEKEQEHTDLNVNKIVNNVKNNTLVQSLNVKKLFNKLDAIKGIVQSLLMQIFNYVPIIVTGILLLVLLVKKAWDAFVEWFSKPFEDLKEYLGKAWDSFLEFFNNSAAWARKNIIDPLKSWWNETMPVWLGGSPKSSKKDEEQPTAKVDNNNNEPVLLPKESEPIQSVRPSTSVTDEVKSAQAISNKPSAGVSSLVVKREENKPTLSNDNNTLLTSVDSSSVPSGTADMSLDSSKEEQGNVSAVSMASTNVNAINLTVVRQDNYLNYV